MASVLLYRPRSEMLGGFESSNGDKKMNIIRHNALLLIIIAMSFGFLPFYLYAEDRTVLEEKMIEKNDNAEFSEIASLPKEIDTLKLSTLIEEALAQNPAIKAAYQEYQANLQKIPQARSLDDPILKYTHFIESVETRVGPQENILGLSQSIPFYQKRDLRAEVASAEAETFLKQYEAVKSIIVAQIKNFYYELFYIYRSIDINEQEKALLRRLSKIASVKYGTGKGSLQNVLQIQVEITKLNDNLLILERQKETIHTHINALLNRPPNHVLPPPEDITKTSLKYDLDTLFNIAKRNRQEILIAKAMIRKNEAALRISKKAFFPDFTFAVQYADVRRRFGFIEDNGKDAWSATVMINLPIWGKRLKAGINESLARLESSAFSKKDIENLTLYQVKNAFLKMKTAEDTLNLYNTTLIPQAEQSYKSAESGYQTGRSDFFNLLDSERALLAVHLAYYRVLADHEQSIADMERYVGLSLASE